jgi:hypothetical protein
MATHLLPVVLGTVHEFIVALVPEAEARHLSLEGVNTLSTNYRRRGICCLLLTLEKDEFSFGLQKSGQVLRDFVAWAGDELKATSRAVGFFDALAVQDWACAEDISRNARPSVNRDQELEEDFLYVSFLMKCFFLDAGEPELEQLLAHWATILAGDRDARHSICLAFFRSDAKAFEAAIRSFLTESSKYYADNPDLEMEEVATEGSLSVEGLALLRLAGRRGFDIKARYGLVPAAALKAPPASLPPDAWRNPE